jgi:hypothetical protein
MYIRINHIVWKHYPGAGKAFFPGGERTTLKFFQWQMGDAALKRKIGLSIELIRDYGLASLVYLGKNQIANDLDFVRSRLADYLYDNAISPVFFADALHAIASESKKLGDQGLSQVQLRNLRRDNIEQALSRQQAQIQDIGYNFISFRNKSMDEKLEILRKLGVIVMGGIKDDEIPDFNTAPAPPVPPLSREITQQDLFPDLLPKKK